MTSSSPDLIMMRGRPRGRSSATPAPSKIVYRRSDNDESSTFRGRSPVRASSPRQRPRRSRSLSRSCSASASCTGASTTTSANLAAAAAASVLSPTRHILLNNRLRRDHCPSRAPSPRRRWATRARSSTRRGETDPLSLPAMLHQQKSDGLSSLRNEIRAEEAEQSQQQNESGETVSPT